MQRLRDKPDQDDFAPPEPGDLASPHQAARIQTLERHAIGLAFVASNGLMLNRIGASSGWLPALGHSCFDVPVLAGMEEEFADLQSGRQSMLSLPGIGLADSGLAEPGIEKFGKFSATIVWSEDDQCFSIVTTRNLGASDTEILVLRARRERQLAMEQAQAAQQRANSEARLALVMRERLKIAHELHDTIVHALVAVVAQLRLVRKFVDRAPEKVSDELALAEQAAQDGLIRAREALGQVRFERAGVDGLASALNRVARRFQERTGMLVETEIDAGLGGESGERAEILYRIVEEALRNVEAHSNARKVSLSAGIVENEILVTLQDDGKGFDTSLDHPGHYGLIGMGEQARMIGGHMTVNSRPGSGVQTKIRAPLSGRE